VGWSVYPSAASRHLVLRASAGETIPDALSAKLREERVSCGWLRASGVLTDVELRAFDGELGTLGSTRRIAGPVHVLALEGAIGLSSGEPSFSLRALLARETDRGLETLAGEIAVARTVALEVVVTALDDVALERALDPAAGVWLLGSASASASASQGHRPAAARPAPPAAPPAWSSALEASDHVEGEPRARTAATSSASASMPLPPRLARPGVDLDSPTPEAGDSVDHFAFGRADVLKSDGDRLHLRVHKDGRVREIALQMLRVTRMPDGEDGKHNYRLERRL
jgi:predicted DNA-binding protein with PD1-like motif